MTTYTAKENNNAEIQEPNHINLSMHTHSAPTKPQNTHLSHNPTPNTQFTKLS